jgi:hypothetical protein
VTSESLKSHPGSNGHGAHLDEHLILDLLRGLLSRTEVDRVLAHARECAACEKLLQERAGEAERLEATTAARLLSEGRAARERPPEAVEVAPGVFGRLSMAWAQAWKVLVERLRQPRLQLAGVAVAAAIALLVVLLPRPGTPPGAFGLYLLPPYSFDLQQREGPGGLSSPELKAGLEAYDKRDFKRAARLLQAAGESPLDPVDERVRGIFLGSALAWSGRYAEAVGVLRAVPTRTLPDPWSGEATWTLYVALRESGREASADSVLRTLARKPGDIGDRSRMLLKPGTHD